MVAAQNVVSSLLHLCRKHSLPVHNSYTTIQNMQLILSYLQRNLLLLNIAVIALDDFEKRNGKIFSKKLD